MYKRILIPLDGSKFAEAALDEVIRLVDEDTIVFLLQVVSLPMPIMTPEMGAQMSVIDVGEMLREAQSYLDEVATTLGAAGIKVKTHVAEDRDIVAAIVNYARTEQVELIIQSTHGRSGLGRLMFGSVAEGVLRQTPCPILLVRTIAEQE